MTPAKQVGWGGVALGFLAFFLAVPPIMVRTPIPIALVGLLAMTAGLLAVRGGEKRLGCGGVVAGPIGIARGLAAAPAGGGQPQGGGGVGAAPGPTPRPPTAPEPGRP